MKTVMRVSTFALLVLFASVPLRGQEQKQDRNQEQRQDQKEEPAPAVESTRPETQFRIRVIVSEFDGAKKISSLPYTLNATSLDPRPRIRTGVRVPVIVGAKAGDISFQYLDVGTNIDCTVEKPFDDGRYPLDFTVGRSTLYVPAAGTVNTKKAWSLGNIPPNADPTIQTFVGQFNVLLRDGQTQDATSVTDPLTGHVINIEVTLNIVK